MTYRHTYSIQNLTAKQIEKNFNKRYRSKMKAGNEKCVFFANRNISQMHVRSRAKFNIAACAVVDIIVVFGIVDNIDCISNSIFFLLEAHFIECLCFVCKHFCYGWAVAEDVIWLFITVSSNDIVLTKFRQIYLFLRSGRVSMRAFYLWYTLQSSNVAGRRKTYSDLYQPGSPFKVETMRVIAWQLIGVLRISNQDI